MKSAIIIKPNQNIGLLCNSIACITSGLFHNESEICGEEIQINDIKLPPITKIPILILDGSQIDLEDVIKKAHEKNLKTIILTREAQFTTDYEEYRRNVETKDLNQLTIIGFGVLGDDKQVSSLCGNIKLLR